MLAFVLCHLAAHSFLLVSEPVATSVLIPLMKPWRSTVGTLILLAAFFIHYGNALWSIYVRRSLRLKRWEWAQLAMGLCIPLFLAQHVATTRISEAALGTDPSYSYILTLYWLVAPHVGVIHATALLIVWIHACIGLHFWLRTKRWYPDWRVYLGALALLIPTLALSGFVSAGNQVRREAAKDEKFVARTLEDANASAETPAGAAAHGVDHHRHAHGAHPPRARRASGAAPAARAQPAAGPEASVRPAAGLSRRHRPRDPARLRHPARVGLRRARRAARRAASRSAGAASSCRRRNR